MIALHVNPKMFYSSSTAPGKHAAMRPAALDEKVKAEFL